MTNIFNDCRMLLNKVNYCLHVVIFILRHTKGSSVFPAIVFSDKRIFFVSRNQLCVNVFLFLFLSVLKKFLGNTILQSTLGSRIDTQWL